MLKISLSGLLLFLLFSSVETVYSSVSDQGQLASFLNQRKEECAHLAGKADPSEFEDAVKGFFQVAEWEKKGIGHEGSVFKMKCQEPKSGLQTEKYYAVKVLNNKCGVIDGEITLLRAGKHEHIVEPYMYLLAKKDLSEFLYICSAEEYMVLKPVIKKDYQVKLVVMEWCDGHELFEIICDIEKHLPDLQKRKPFLIDLCSKLVKTVKFLHGQKIAHCDLKPENIMIDMKDGRILRLKLIDFGFSITGPRQSPVFFGSYEYSAPETYNHGVYNECCDIWSLGGSFYSLLCRQYPYQFDPNIAPVRGNGPKASAEYVIAVKKQNKIFSEMATEEKIHLMKTRSTETFPDCPDELYELIDLCTKYNPEERGSVTEIEEMLKKLSTTNF